ncbi:ABC transporter permease subunit [Vallitalea sediminicola]
MDIRSKRTTKVNTGLKNKGLLAQVRKHWILYLMLLPCLVYFFIFKYIPMGGLLLAFKEFKFNKSLLESPWVGFQYFEAFFSNYQFPQLLRNTIVIGLIKIVLEFPFPIILALMLNEVKSKRFKRISQTISYLPHFISWVVAIAIVQRVLAPDIGLMNQFKTLFGGDGSTFYLMEGKYFYSILFSSDIWKSIGWGSIIYLAAISGIDPQLYEAARIDGATKAKEIWHITLPGIRTTAGILFIMGLGGLISTGFEQLMLLRTPGNMSLADTLDVYVIKTGLTNGQYGYATAVGLIQGIVGLILVITANKLSKKYSEVSVW